MNQQTPIPNSSTPPTPNRDWREQRRAERWARHEAHWQMHARRPFSWTGGAILMIVGVIFLLENMGLPFLVNGWALFLLIPAFWAYVATWNCYQNNGQLTQRGVTSLTLGVLLTILAFVFLLNLDIGLIGPVLLIAGGLVLLATTFLQRDQE